MSETSSEPTAPVPVPAAVRGPYAPPPGQAAASAPAWIADAPGRPADPASATPRRIDRFAAPKRRTSLLLALLAGIAVAAVLVATGLVRVPGAPSPTPSVTGVPSATPTGRGPGFTMPTDPGARGSWEILAQEWEADGVQVHVKVYGLAGTVEYGFQGYPKGSSKGVRPVSGEARSPELDRFSLQAGETADGWLFLPLTRGETTFFLTSKTGRLLSAQPLTP